MKFDSKPHYVFLDGLRGVAAIMVVLYHLFEAVAFAAKAPEQKMFHGFLAVDFFFVLSGFVMGYAYDDRWDKMSIRNFFSRRLIRLHPMVVLGVVFGLLIFVIQGCCNWNGDIMPLSSIFISLLLALCLLPSPLSIDLRGNTEMFPLNGPHWSLFFEYIGNIAYALFIRKFSDNALRIWIVIVAIFLCWYGFAGPECGSIGFGWSVNPSNMLGGVARMFISYPIGLLLARIFRKNIHIYHGEWLFFACALVLCLLLSVPSMSHINNDLKIYYELFCIIIAFPAIVWFAAHGFVKSKCVNRVVTYLGNISYPLYAIHYPLIYLYIDWINKGVKPFGENDWCTPVVLFIIAILLGTLSFYLYDKPIRKYLNRLIK